jgi:membrane protease subunit HflC
MIYNQAYGRDPKFFDFYRSMQALDAGLPKDTTTFVGPPTGDFFRFFGAQNGEVSGRDMPGAAPAPAPAPAPAQSSAPPAPENPPAAQP